MDTAILIIPVIVVAAIVWFIARIDDTKNSKEDIIHCELDGNRKTRIISNKVLSEIQLTSGNGGKLMPNDLVIVWAREFLDNDLLFKPVQDNVYEGIQYLYLIDRRNADRFTQFLEKLRNIVDEELIRNRINVVLLRPELTLNNYVLLAYGTEREELYSSLIFDDTPFGWLLQSHHRQSLFNVQVKKLVATLAVSAFIDANRIDDEESLRLKDSSVGMLLEDQIMDYSSFGGQILAARPKSLDEYDFDLKLIVSGTKFPDPQSVITDLRYLRRSASR